MFVLKWGIYLSTNGNPYCPLMGILNCPLTHERIYIQEAYQTFYAAKDDLDDFISYYAEERLHQGIGFVTLKDRYIGKDKETIEQRQHNHHKALEKRKRKTRKCSQRHVA